MAVHYPQQDYVARGSQTTPVPEDLISAVSVHGSIRSVGQARMFPSSIHVERDFVVDVPNVGVVRVLNSFYIRVQRVEGGFVAVSGISDVYELGETASQAVVNYLFSLVDELVWFREHKESLSSSMLRDCTKLQFYLSLV